MRYLGIDYGLKRIGIAISDFTNTIATPIENVINDKNKFEKLREVITEYNVEKIVLGLPKNMNNTEGKSAEMAREFKSKLEELFKMEVVLEDERLTTVSAHKIMIQNNVARKNKRQKVDSLAAALILQVYLDRKRR